MRSYLRVAFCLSLSLAACGNETSEDTVNDETLLSKLSDAEARALCRDWESAARAGFPEEKAYCTFEASAYGPQACVVEVSACVASKQYEQEKNEDWGCQEVTADDFFDADEGPCNASVGEWRACIDAGLAQYSAMAQQASCEHPQTFEADEPEACALVLAKCPGADI